MISLRSVLQCIGVDRTDVSVLRHVLGFSRGVMPTEPDPNTTATVSLRQVIQGVQGQHVHVNVIRVGWDLIPDSNLDAARDRLDYSVYRARNILRQRSLGVGRVQHWAITSAEADGADDIGSRSEASDLWDSWFVDNDGLDVFVVRTISATDFIGRSPVGGSCSKSGKNSGLLGGGNDHPLGAEGLSRTFTHEIGHFLGLDHNHGARDGCDGCPGTMAGRSNLMAQTGCAQVACGGPGVRDAILLTSGQGTTIRAHCSAKGGC